MFNEVRMASTYEVSVEAVEAVARVGVVIGLGLKVADVVHYLVLAFAGSLRVRTGPECKYWAYTSIRRCPWQRVEETRTWCPERITVHCCQPASVEILRATKYCRCRCSSAMKRVPGVMQFESKRSDSGNFSPFF